VYLISLCRICQYFTRQIMDLSFLSNSLLGFTMKRWILPIVYFVVCETLYLIYELGLTRLSKESVWTWSIIFLVILISPVTRITRGVEQYIAKFFDLPFNQHQFLPRFLSTQFAILTCTFILAVFSWVITKNYRNKNLIKP